MSQKKKFDIGVMQSELTEAMTLSEKQSAAALRTNEIKKKKMKDEVHLFIKYRRRNGLKVGMREASRVLQCSINSVRKYWLTELDYPIQDEPKKGWKYNRHGVIEPIKGLGPLDDDSDFFTVRERRLPDFLDDTQAPRAFVKKKKAKSSTNKGAKTSTIEFTDDVPMPDFLQEGYVAPVKTEEAETPPVEDDLYADRPMGRMPKRLRKRVVSHEEEKKFEAELRDWAREDDDGLKTYLNEFSVVSGGQNLKTLNSTFKCLYYLNMRDKDGQWYFRRQEMSHRMDAFLDGEEYHNDPKMVLYTPKTIYIKVLPNGEFEIDKKPTVSASRSINADLNNMNYMSHYKPLSKKQKALLKSKKKLDDEAAEIFFKTDWFAYLTENIDWDLIKSLHAKAVAEAEEMKRKHEETEAAKAEDLRQQRERIKKEERKQAKLRQEAKETQEKHIEVGPSTIPYFMKVVLADDDPWKALLHERDRLQDWVKEDADLENDKKELSSVVEEATNSKTFVVKYYMNMRNSDGIWLFRHQERLASLQAIEDKKDYKPELVDYVAPLVKFEVKKGSLVFKSAEFENEAHWKVLDKFLSEYKPLTKKEAKALANHETPPEEQSKLRFKTGWRRYIADNLDMSFIQKLYDGFTGSETYLEQIPTGKAALKKWLREDDESLKDYQKKIRVYQCTLFGKQYSKVDFHINLRAEDGLWFYRLEEFGAKQEGKTSVWYKPVLLQLRIQEENGEIEFEIDETLRSIDWWIPVNFKHEINELTEKEEKYIKKHPNGKKAKQLKFYKSGFSGYILKQLDLDLLREEYEKTRKAYEEKWKRIRENNKAREAGNNA